MEAGFIRRLPSLYYEGWDDHEYAELAIPVNGTATYFMTLVVLEQRTRGDHGSIREARVARERLKEGLELEVGSEGVRWPSCGELLQLVSDIFGGHRETCRTRMISGVSS